LNQTKISTYSPVEENPTLSRRETVKLWIDSSQVQKFIIFVIVFNSLTLGLETSPWIVNHVGAITFSIINYLVLLVFIVELIIKIYAQRAEFLLDGWNWFDCLLVILSLFPLVYSYFFIEERNYSANNHFAIFRVLRVLRLLRVLKTNRKIRIMVETFLQTIPNIVWLTLVFLMIFYIWALVGTIQFGGTYNDWFGDLGKSFYTLFQIMTLESWSMGIARPVMENYPYAWLFFIPFILLSSYTIINLLIAMVTNTMQSIQAEEARDIDLQLAELKAQAELEAQQNMAHALPLDEKALQARERRHKVSLLLAKVKEQFGKSGYTGSGGIYLSFEEYSEFLHDFLELKDYMARVEKLLEDKLKKKRDREKEKESEGEAEMIIIETREVIGSGKGV
jgi:voltage-gated sodium channel